MNKSLKNSYFCINKEFLGVAYTLLLMGAIQADDMNSAKKYFYQAFEYQSPRNITMLVPDLLEVIPASKRWEKTVLSSL